MRPGPAAAADWVMEFLPRSQPPTDPEVLIVRIGEELGWFTSPEDAQEKAELWRAPFLRRLRFSVNDPERRGRPRRFEFGASEEDMIQGSCYIEHEQTEEVRRSKARRLHIDTYLGFIRNLTGRQFEGVCRGVLALLGCENPVLTPRGNDQGIDFYGLIEMRGRLNMTYVETAVDEAMHSYVIGQAKQIAGKVSTSEVRDLVGAVEIARVGVSADEGQALSGLGMRPYDPVWRIFVTTGDFSRDAIKLINRLGILGVDGVTVAAILAGHEVANVDGTCDQGAFDSWVAGHLHEDAE